MKFWFTHSSAISLHTQLMEQVRLGIASGELAAGERLPSVRAFARFHGIHANTVSAAYSQLERQGFVHHTRGGGTYVNRHTPSIPANDFEGVIRTMRKEGVSDTEIAALFREALEVRSGYMLVEPDEEAARLVLFEVNSSGGHGLQVCPMPQESYHALLRKGLNGSTAVVLPSRAHAVREVLGDDTEIAVLEISPFTNLFADQLPASRDYLIGVVSHWPRFLEIASAMLVSAGFHPDALVCRDARSRDWQLGLRSAAVVICDSFTASVMPAEVELRVFPLLSRKSLELFQSG